MPALLVFLLFLICGAASAQTNGATLPPPSTPPGLPSPNQAPIPPFPSTNEPAKAELGKASPPTTVAPPAYESPVDELGLNDVGLRNADTVTLDSDNNATAKGNVSLRYRTYTLYADQATINTDTGIGTMDGHVRVVSDDGTVSVNSQSANSKLTLNMRSGIYHVIGASAVVGQNNLPDVTGLALPIRLYGGDIEETPRFVDARDTSVTTCDFANPHYFFKAKTTTIIPGKRLIARDVTLYRRHRKIITIPYILFPLDDRYARQGITPLIGEDSDEGYFAKFAVPYALAAAAVGILRLDLMSKTGVGTGVTQSFVTSGTHQSSAGNGAPTLSPATTVSSTPSVAAQQGVGGPGSSIQNGGTVQIYHVANSSTGLNTTTGSLSDNQVIFHNVKLAIDSQFQNDSYLSSDSESNAISSLFTLTRAVKGATTSLSTNIQQSSYGEGTSRTITTSLDENNALSKTSNLAVKIDLSQFDTPGYAGVSGTSQNTLATNLDYTARPKGYQFEVQANTFNATSSSSGAEISGGVQRLPEISLQSVPSPTDRLFPRLLPPLSKFLFDLGDFKETVDNTQDMRLQLGLDTGNNTYKEQAVTTSFDGSFLQSFYSDNTAEYILKDQMGATYAFQKQSTFGATYSYLRPYGYTPFLFDETGSYNNINVNLSDQPNKRLLMTVSSGFDVGQDHTLDGIPATPWLDINGQIQYRIDSRLLNVMTSSYDPNRGMLFNVADTTRVTLPWGFAFNSALTYVPQSHRVSNINGDLDIPWITDKREQSGYTLRALAGYDGLTDQISYDGFELTRSWHDWELSAVYQNNTNSATPGNSFFLNFRLKAFPGYEPFGVGQFGQGLDTGQGQVF